MLRIKRSDVRRTILRAAAAPAILLLMLASNCSRPRVPAGRLPITLRIGLGLTAGAAGADRALDQAVRNIALEGLVSLRRDGRIVPRLAERWSLSEDGLSWSIHLRPAAA